MNGGTQIPLPLRPAAAPDTVTRDLNRLIETPIRRSIMERYGLARVPGSPVFDEDGEEA